MLVKIIINNCTETVKIKNSKATDKEILLAYLNYVHYDKYDQYISDIDEYSYFDNVEWERYDYDIQRLKTNKIPELNI